MDIAIKYEKIELEYDMFMFKPIGVIYGNYYSDDEVFETNYGETCLPIDGDCCEGEYFFDRVVKFSDLKEKLNNIPEEELLEYYFNDSKETFVLGVYDYTNGKIKTLEITYEEFLETTKQREKIRENFNETLQNADKIEIGYSIDELLELRKIDNLEQLHKKIDSLINGGKEIKKQFENKIKKNSNKNLEEVFNDENEYVEPKLKLDRKKSKTLTLKELRKEVFNIIKGQDEAVEDITRTIFINETSNNYLNKSHILFAGPSGTGKTEIINIIANKLDLPYFKADATSYSKTGYQGKEVYSMLEGLIIAANGDIEKAQKGILIIDEIDKKANTGNTREDDFDKEVLNSLLKIMDRDIVEIEINRQKVMFNTSDLTVILIGSFDNLYRKKEVNNKRTIGFQSVFNDSNGEREITEEDLLNWLTPELRGRIGLVASTKKLTIEDVVEILYKSKKSQLKITKEDFKNRGIKLTYTSGFVREIAKKGISEKTGVRNLNNTVKESLKYAYDEILTRKGIKELKLTKQTALNPRKYYTK